MDIKTYGDIINVYKNALDTDDVNAELVLSYILNTPIYKIDRNTPIAYSTVTSLLEYLYEALSGSST